MPTVTLVLLESNVRKAPVFSVLVAVHSVHSVLYKKEGLTKMLTCQDLSWYSK